LRLPVDFISREKKRSKSPVAPEVSVFFSILIATVRPMAGSWARKTIPIPPAPMTSITVYLPICRMEG
jgi:hypothetical protein